jgi:hypothetical protein
VQAGAVRDDHYSAISGRHGIAAFVPLLAQLQAVVALAAHKARLDD